MSTPDHPNDDVTTWLVSISISPVVLQEWRILTERRLNWYGHVMWRDGEHILRKVLRADIPGKRKKGRPKTRWKDACQRDLKSTGLRAGEETDRAMSRRKIISYTGDPT